MSSEDQLQGCGDVSFDVMDDDAGERAREFFMTADASRLYTVILNYADKSLLGLKDDALRVVLDKLADDLNPIRVKTIKYWQRAGPYSILHFIYFLLLCNQYSHHLERRSIELHIDNVDQAQLYTASAWKLLEPVQCLRLRVPIGLDLSLVKVKDIITDKMKLRQLTIQPERDLTLEEWDMIEKLPGRIAKVEIEWIAPDH